MKQIFQAVLFDLGDTLMYSPDPWPPVFELAGRRLAHTLCSYQIQVNTETFHAEFLHQLNKYYTDRERNLEETTTLTVLHNLLVEKGQRDIPLTTLRTALNEFYAVTQQNWQLEEDAISVLSTLKQFGLHLGLVSNAGDDLDVRQQVKKFNIGGYFDFVLTSAACGYRKPHPRMFSQALNLWGYLPDEIAMVGDRLDADIGGAHPLGIFTIWNKRRAKIKSINNQHEPNVVVDSLSEIPRLFANNLPTKE